MLELIKLPYTSLAPVISDETLSFHHGKHLQAYVDNLNKLIAGTQFENKSLVDIIVISSEAISSVTSSAVERSIFNNAGQILNHEMYFSQFTSSPSFHGMSVESPLGRQIEKQWGSVDAFKAEFEAKGVGLFGSGWVWLQSNADGELSIAQYSNADNPVAHGLKPILTFDVWEHAYYLDYQNRRAAHLQALWPIVDWKVLERRYETGISDR